MIPEWLRPARKTLKAWLRCELYGPNVEAVRVSVWKGDDQLWHIDCEDTRPSEIQGRVDLKVEVLKVTPRPFPGLTTKVIRAADDLDWTALVYYMNQVAWVNTGSLSPVEQQGWKA